MNSAVILLHVCLIVEQNSTTTTTYMHFAQLHIRDGTGQDFPDPTGKFQNHRRLTGRSTGF